MVPVLDRYQYLLLALILAAGAVFSYLFGSYAYEINGQFGFPPDDPWIHLQLAKNPHEYGSFSYYKNEMVTAGSTSPLYTILLAFGFFFTSNEMVLSYLLGAAFLLVASFFVFKLIAELQSGRPASGSVLLALGASLLVLLEARMQWAALSGMETTLFICLALGVLYFYQTRQSVALGVAGGLLMWTRPEAIILFVAIALDVVYHSVWALPQKGNKKSGVSQPPSIAWLKISLAITALFSFAYAVFNLALSGSIFPNTFAAKVKYYGGDTVTDFPAQVFRFLADGHMAVIAALAAVGIAAVVFRFVKRRAQSQLVAVLFSFGMFLAYWMKLPYLYQEGRYMMPVLPFVLLLGISGLYVLSSGKWNLLKSMSATGVIAVQSVVILFAGAQFSYASLAKRGEFAEMCRYISDRQVRTAKWLRNNTPDDAIIATHDIGAIAFYSGRKIADMVGLVSPEMIERIGNLNRLHHFLVEKKTTHVAVLRNWFEIVNQPPLFKTDERYPEIMEVFAFDPQRTHLATHDASRGAAAAGQYLYQGQFNVAAEILRRVVAIDPRNSKAHHLRGTALMMVGELDEAARGFDTALQLYPEFLEAKVGLAQVAARRNDPTGAITRLESIRHENPDYPIVYHALADMYRTFGLDSVKAQAYMQRYRDLVDAQQKHAEGGG